MTFHLGGFGETIDLAGAFGNLAALQDSRLFTEGDNLRVPELNQVFCVAAGIGSGGNGRVRLDSPTLDAGVRPEILPVNGLADGDAEPSNPKATVDLVRSPMLLSPDENLTVQADSNTSAAAFQWCLLWFSDGAPTPISGADIMTVRGTNTDTLTVDTWTQGNLTLDEALPPGNYGVVGMRAQSAGLVAARVVFRTGAQYRPGVLGSDTAGDLDQNGARGGDWGLWGTFPFTQTPAIEFLSVSADSSQVVLLDLIEV